MEVSQILLSDCLNLSTVVLLFFFLSALSSSTADDPLGAPWKTQPCGQRGFSQTIWLCSATLILAFLSFFFSSVVLFMTRQEIHKKL